MSAKRYRLMYKFWLDMQKPDEAELADQIEILKTDRSFAKVIRDGIRLVNDLRKGKLDVLFELYPWVRAEFLEYTRSLQPLPVADNASVAVQLARLEKLLLEQGNIPVNHTAEAVPSTGGPGTLKMLATPAAGNARPLAAPPIAAQVFDDDDDEILVLRRDSSDGVDASRNFLKSVLSISGAQ